VPVLDKFETTNYFEGKAEYVELLKSFNDRNIVKVTPGKDFVLFERTTTGYRVHDILTVNHINMDEDGVWLDIEGLYTGKLPAVGYTPTPVFVEERAVFLSVPSSVKVELRVTECNGGYVEEVSAAMLVKHRHSPLHDRLNELQLLSLDLFMLRVGEAVAKELLDGCYHA
jgi:hypothetical protein